MMFDLTGQTALVTGADRGIGAGMAKALASAGAEIIGASRTIAEDGGDVGRQIRAMGGVFRAERLDLSDRGEVAAFAERMAPEVDILVANAGTIERAPAEEMSLDAWDHVFEVNLRGQFALIQPFGRKMLTAGGGRIIVTASLLSFQGGINVAAYTATKSGLVGMVRALSNEWSGSGVTVNAIAPGYIETENTQALRDDPARSRAILDRIPVGRWGDPDDLGGATVFLASPSASYVTGIVLPVDGGWLAR